VFDDTHPRQDSRRVRDHSVTACSKGPAWTDDGWPRRPRMTSREF
jgi:hypothetical protein